MREIHFFSVDSAESLSHVEFPLENNKAETNYRYYLVYLVSSSPTDMKLQTPLISVYSCMIIPIYISLTPNDKPLKISSSAFTAAKLCAERYCIS